MSTPTTIEAHRFDLPTDLTLRPDTRPVRPESHSRPSKVTYPHALSPPRISQGTIPMTIFDPSRPRVVDTGRGGFLRLIALGIGAFLLVILIFSAITRVNTGH